ncbi:putative ribonuclease H-like domain-containing protein [Tanacetum coccineum]
MDATDLTFSINSNRRNDVLNGRRVGLIWTIQRDTIRQLIESPSIGLGSTSGIRACALRNFDVEVMEFETAQTNTTAKLPILKQGEYEMWEMRIKQYFQNGTSVTKMIVPITAKEKICKKNDIKARGLLLMSLPNEHKLTFSQSNDAQTMLQKLVSRLAILGVVITSEDLNLKFLRSLPSEWDTHVVVWMNKPDIETISIDDLYNNFKIVEQKVKKSIGASTVSTGSTNVNTASFSVSTAIISDNTVYAFMVENPNGSNVLHQDLEQIHEDDLEAMDLKWQFSLLSMRAKKYFQRTGRKIFINRNDTVGYDKSKVECFNCHKLGHFARECRNPRSQDNRSRNQESTRRIIKVEDTSSKAMFAIDGIGFDWSDMAEEQVQTSMALMAFSDSEVYNETSCSKTCLKNFESLKKQCDDLIVKLNESKFKATTYKKGLATVEEQLVKFRKNEVLFGEEIDVLKRELGCKDYELGVLKAEYEKVKQEKEGIDFKISKFDNASKCLDKLLESQITNKSKKGLGYHVVAPPHPLTLNAPTRLDLSYSGLDKFKEPEFNRYGPRDTVLKPTINYEKESDNPKENSDDSLPKEQVSEDEISSVESSPNVVKEAVFHSAKKVEFVKSKNNEKPVRKSVSFDHMEINCSHHQRKRVVIGNNYNKVDYDYNAKISHPCMPQMNDKGFVDSGCSRHMIGNIAYLSNFKEFDGGYVTFGGGAYGGRISGKGTLKTNNRGFKDVYFVNELKFNLFSVSQMCDKKNYVLFTDIECLVLSPDFNLPDENQILLRIPRKDNMYSFDMQNIIPKENSTCVVAKATTDESMLWHRRLGHINFKNINKLVKENLVRGLPLKRFENDQTCVACLKGKQHKASYKTKLLNPITKTLFMLHMDLFGPTFNRVLIVKPHNKTPYELFRGFKPALSFMKPFGCHVTILNTLDSLGKFDGKSDEGFFVRYSLSSKAFRVYNITTRKVEENLHIRFLENKPMIEGNGPKWLFDIDSLTQSMNYVPIAAGTISNESVGMQEDLNAYTLSGKEGSSKDCIVMPIWKDASYFDLSTKDVDNGEPKSVADDPKQVKDGLNIKYDDKDKSDDDNSFKEDNTAEQQLNTVSPGVNTSSPEVNTVVSPVNTASPNDMLGANHTLESTHIKFVSDEDKPEVKLGDILSSYTVPTTPHTRIHKDHPLENVIGDIQSSVQIRKSTSEQGFLSAMYEEKTHKDLHTCLFACFLSQEEPKRVTKALSDPAWVEVMHEELLQIEAIRLFLAYASFMGFMVYQMDVKSAFLYGTIEDEVYVCQPPGFEDLEFPDKVYKVVKALYGLHQAPRAWYETLAKYQIDNRFQRGKIDPTLFIKRQKEDVLLVQVYVDDIIFGSTKKEMCDEFEKLMKDKFQMSSMGELTFFLGLQVKQKADGIFISQDKYVGEILRKFNYTDVKSTSTTVDLEKPLVKDGDTNDVDVHLYRSMIGSLMYLTAFRPDIMFAVCACARFQVTPTISHLTAVKRIFRYLKGKPTLGLWYFRDSPFQLVAYSDSDYNGATQDRKSTTRGCQFLGNRLISWQCKK